MIHEFKVSPALINKLHKEGTLPLNDIIGDKDFDTVVVNDAFLLKAGKQSAIGIYRDDKVHVLKNKHSIMGHIKAENLEQSIYMEYLKDENIVCVLCTGASGSGKTILAIAYAYSAVLDGLFDEIVLARPYVAPSKKFQSGLLPGTLEEKMRPWMEVFYHNLDKVKTMSGKKGMKVEIKEQSLEHIKGQTFDRTIFILDEAEDFNVDEMSAVLTRVGKYSKILVLGDAEQATEKGCKKTLGDVIKKFRAAKAPDKEKRMFASIELKTSLRSEFVNFILKVFK